MKTTNQAEMLLSKSIEQYTAITDLMRSMAQIETCNGYTELTKLGNTLLQQQQTAVVNDRMIMEAIADFPEITQSKLMLERHKLLKKAARLNSVITPQITGIKSLLFNELQQVKNGRSAMKGYQQAVRPHGRNLNSTL